VLATQERKKERRVGPYERWEYNYDYLKIQLSQLKSGFSQQREIMLFIGKPKGRSKMISNLSTNNLN